jgi:methyltransferase (TIGR00027 family)
LGVRAWDASLTKPVCGDSYAHIFMDEEAKKVWHEFQDQLRPNSSNAARHAIIDQQVQEALTADPTSKVVVVGAGFDSRAFRLKGGQWIEVDEPQIINVKELKLPPSKSQNKLTRIPIDFGKESLSDKLEPHRTEQLTHVIIEGVLMYLNDDKRLGLLKILQSNFPRHIVYCDLMRRSFFERYSKPIHAKIVGLGATFTELKEQPENIFLENGYKQLSSVSIPEYASKYGKLDIPRFMVKYFLKTLRRGYLVNRFEYSKN